MTENGIFFGLSALKRDVAQLASALALGARGPGFESLRPDNSLVMSNRDSN